MSADCAFCRILRHELPAAFVYQDADVAAFLDLFPVNPGHTLIVPRSHAADLLDCASELAGKLFAVAARLAPAVVAATGAEGFNVWTANGRVAGQTVFHLHLHLLPRFKTDGFGLRFPRGSRRQAAREALERMAGRIRAEG